MILSFADRQPRVVAVPAAPFVVGILLHELPSAEVGAVKGDFKLILTTVLLQHGCNVDALGGEHVVRLENGLAVQHDGGKGIQTVKGQHGFGTLRDGVRGGEGGAVQPLGLADPLDVELVLADEGVGDDAVVDEVEVDVCRELADGEQFGVLLVGLLEVPVLVDGRHAPGGCLCALGRVSCAGAVWQARVEAHCERIRNGIMPIEGIRKPNSRGRCWAVGCLRGRRMTRRCRMDAHRASCPAEDGGVAGGSWERRRGCLPGVRGRSQLLNEMARQSATRANTRKNNLTCDELRTTSISSLQIMSTSSSDTK